MRKVLDQAKKESMYFCLFSFFILFIFFICFVLFFLGGVRVKEVRLVQDKLKTFNHLSFYMFFNFIISRYLIILASSNLCVYIS